MKNLVISGFILLGVVGCQNPTEVENSSQTQQIVKLQKQTTNNQVFLADLGAQHNGQPTGVNLSLNINTPSSGFETKSSDGQVQGLVSNIRSYKVSLVSDSLNPSTTTNIAGGGSVFIVDRDGSTLTTGGSHSITFANVPVGTWFAAVSAYDAVNAGGNNITKSVSYSDGAAKLSVSGSSIEVQSDLKLNPSGGSLNVALELQPEIGASISTSITPQDGTVAGAYGAN